VLATVTVVKHGGKTKQTLQSRVIYDDGWATPDLEGMEAGWTQSLE
jgi:hypothetical protein